MTGFNVGNAVELLGLQSEWFGLADLSRLTDAERRRARPVPTAQTVFRGFGRGAQVGPYLSQFLLIGNSGVNSVDDDSAIADGFISYGSLRV